MEHDPLDGREHYPWGAGRGGGDVPSGERAVAEDAARRHGEGVGYCGGEGRGVP